MHLIANFIWTVLQLIANSIWELMHLIANFIKQGVPLKESLVFALKRKREGSRSSLLLENCAYSIAEKYDFILCFARFTLPLPALSICLLMDAYFRICSTLATSTGRCMWIVIRPFRGGEVIWVSQIKTYKIEIPRNRCGRVEFLLYFWSNPLTPLPIRTARSGWAFFI